MLMRDVANLRDFFGQFAPELLKTQYGPELWSLYQSGLLSNDTPLAAMYAYSRVLRLADGPDEVHRGVVAKMELKKYEK